MSTQHRQSGSALIVGLLLLVVMTIIGLTAIQTTTMQERMAGNVRDVNLAFQAAEAALRDGEAFLQGAVLPAFNGNNGLYQMGTGSTKLWETVDWEDDARVYDGVIQGVFEQPRYIIEELPATPSEGQSLAADEPVQESGMYRVTARGVGGSDLAVVVLQSTYRR